MIFRSIFDFSSFFVGEVVCFGFYNCRLIKPDVGFQISVFVYFTRFPTDYSKGWVLRFLLKIEF